MPELPSDPDGPAQVLTQAIEGPLRSTRIISQPDIYAPSMTGKSYEYTMTQLESQVVLHSDAHMYSQEDFYQSEPKVMIEIMTHFSLKAGFKEWGDKARSAANINMKQLKLGNAFIPMHRRDLTYEECQMLLELHMFFKRKRDVKIKVRPVAGGNKHRT